MEGRVAGVASWADARLRDARLVASYPSLRALLTAPPSARGAGLGHVRQLLQALIRYQPFRAAYLVGPNGSVIVSAGEGLATHEALNAGVRHLKGRREAGGGSLDADGRWAADSDRPAHGQGWGGSPLHLVGSDRARGTGARRDRVRGGPGGLSLPAPRTRCPGDCQRRNPAARAPARRQRLHHRSQAWGERARSGGGVPRVQATGRARLGQGPGILGGRERARRVGARHDAPGARYELGAAVDGRGVPGAFACQPAGVAGCGNGRRDPPGLAGRRLRTVASPPGRLHA